MNHIAKTGDGGQTWTTISPDLSCNDRGKQLTTKLNLLPDPRVRLTDADYKAQRDLALAIRDDVSPDSLFCRSSLSTTVDGKLQCKHNSTTEQRNKQSNAQLTMVRRYQADQPGQHCSAKACQHKNYSGQL